MLLKTGAKAKEGVQTVRPLQLQHVDRSYIDVLANYTQKKQKLK